VGEFLDSEIASAPGMFVKPNSDKDCAKFVGIIDVPAGGRDMLSPS